MKEIEREKEKILLSAEILSDEVEKESTKPELFLFAPAVTSLMGLVSPAIIWLCELCCGLGKAQNWYFFILKKIHIYN